MKVQEESENTESQCRCKNSHKPTIPELNRKLHVTAIHYHYYHSVDVCTVDMVSVNMFLFLKD